MDREDDAEQCLAQELWGYPDILKKFKDEVRPVLVEARDARKTDEGEEEGHEDRIPEHNNISSSVPSVINNESNLGLDDNREPSDRLDIGRESPVPAAQSDMQTPSPSAEDQLLVAQSGT